MIQGHIDLASRTRVEGWMHSTLAPLGGAVVLAFVDDQCVGSGVVGLFRQDLVDANLGDGYGGFAFDVVLQPWQDHRTIEVRLESSNLLIRQAATRLTVHGEAVDARRRPVPDPLTLSWQLGRGWIQQNQYDALRLFGQFGLHALPVVADAAGDELARLRSLAAQLGPLLEFLLCASVRIEVRRVSRLSQLQQIRRNWHDQSPWAPPAIGLWSATPSALRVVEGSHTAHWSEQAVTGGSPALTGAIEYEFGAATLLLLNLDCRFALVEEGPHYRALIPQVSRAAARSVALP